MSRIPLRTLALSACLGLVIHNSGAQAAAPPPYLTGVDRGASPFGGGIVPVPGQGVLPFWGGNSLSFAGSVETAEDDVLRAVVNGSDVTPAAYQFGAFTNIQLDRLVVFQNYVAVGYVGGTCGGLCLPGPTHAAYWNGNTGFVDLHPAKYVSSFAQGVDGFHRIAGAGADGGGLLHPLYWDLNEGTVPVEMTLPAGFTQGAMTAASLAQCFGAGWGIASSGQTHPLAWCNWGNTTTVRDLLPPDGISGVVVGADPNDGNADLGGSLITTGSNGQYHAALWPNANPVTFVDLHPTSRHFRSFTASSVYALRLMPGDCECQTIEAGLGVIPHGRKTSWHALVWFGTAASAFDLQTALPPQFVQSVATGVDENGNVEGAALDTAGLWHDIFWQRNPSAP